ncbi:MAG: N-acetylmuramic acid 6-phosphate etherase [Candidatus Riflebacteria bacterium]|nr:N-acetylmuramic acid 6-phosphate etherase [Candidatus Riflebacteria bacterium]
MKKSSPTTETRNSETMSIDRMTVREQVEAFSREDSKIIEAIMKVSHSIERAIEKVVEGFKQGGRLIYIGAGTSGRLGVLDASECPPTFGVDSSMVTALIAGGNDAIISAAEGAEDNEKAGEDDLRRINFDKKDVLVGITASGTTPYVRGACRYARTLNAITVLLTCNPEGDFPETDILINPVTGPEVITGSTRLKAGTATKMVLNMISSISMIRIGKVYGNLMVDVKATNKKLRQRAKKILMDGGKIDENKAVELLEKTGGDLKTAIFIAKSGGTKENAQKKILHSEGFLYKALNEE